MGSTEQPTHLEISSAPLYGELEIGQSNGVLSRALDLATKSWQSLSWEIITTAVGVSAFGLANLVGVFGVVGFLLIFIMVGWTSFRVSAWWKEHQTACAKAGQEKSLGYKLERYEDYGSVVHPKFGKAFLGCMQFFQVFLVCVVFHILLGMRMKEVTRWFVKEQPDGLKSHPSSDLSDKLGEWGELYVEAVSSFTSVLATTKNSENIPWDKLESGESMIDSKMIGYMSDHDGTKTWKSVDDLTELRVGEAWLKLETNYFVRAAEAKYSAKAKTVSADWIALVLTNVLALAGATLQPIGDVDRFLGYIGIGGVIFSWLLVIIKMAGDSSGVSAGLPSADEVQCDWMPTGPVKTFLGEEGGSWAMLQEFCKIMIAAITAFGVSNLIPQFSKSVEPKHINKALAVGFIAMFSVYLIPVGIYMLKGKSADALEFIKKDTNPTMKLMFEIAVCANMIASFAIAGQSPATQLRNLFMPKKTTNLNGLADKEANGNGSTKIKIVFRLIVAVVQIGISLLMPDGDFFLYLTLFMSVCLPIIAIIMPMIANWRIRSIVGQYEDESAPGGGRTAGPGWLTWLERPMLLFMFVIAFVCIPVGSMSSWNDIRSGWIVEGLVTAPERVVTPL